MPTDAQSFPLPVPSPGYRVSGKEVEVCDSGSRHHQLCGCCNLQLIQSHVWHLVLAHQQESFLPFSSRKSLSCCLSRVVPLFPLRTSWFSYSPSELHGPSHSLQNLVPRPIYFRTSWFSPFPSEPHGPLLLWLPRLGLNPRAHLPLQPHF